jgi:hypothetical protein
MDNIEQLKSEIAHTRSRVTTLVSIIEDLYSRPPMEYTEAGWEGYILYWDIFVQDKVAPLRPRWNIEGERTSTGSLDTLTSNGASGETSTVHLSTEHSTSDPTSGRPPSTYSSEYFSYDTGNT